MTVIVSNIKESLEYWKNALKKIILFMSKKIVLAIHSWQVKRFLEYG